jgi:hypothetical protein
MLSFQTPTRLSLLQVHTHTVQRVDGKIQTGKCVPVLRIKRSTVLSITQPHRQPHFGLFWVVALLISTADYCGDRRARFYVALSLLVQRVSL